MQDGDVDVAGAAATTAGRDAMLRHAATAVATSDASSGGEAAIARERAFVTGLAAALGVPERRATTIVHAATSAVLRSALLDAGAAKRRGADGNFAGALRRVRRAVDVLPMPPDAAEAAAVGAGLRNHLSGSEVEAILRALVRRAFQVSEPCTARLSIGPRVRDLPCGHPNAVDRAFAAVRHCVAADFPRCAWLVNTHRRFFSAGAS